MVPFSLLLFWPSLSPRNREVMLGPSLMYFVRFPDALRGKTRKLGTTDFADMTDGCLDGV